MVSNFAWLPRQRVAPGTARRRQQVAVGPVDLLWGTASGFLPAKKLETLIYGFQFRVAFAAASESRLSLADYL